VQLCWYPWGEVALVEEMDAACVNLRAAGDASSGRIEERTAPGRIQPVWPPAVGFQSALVDLGAERSSCASSLVVTWCVLVSSVFCRDNSG
jgi:hypothetical protein